MGVAHAFQLLDGAMGTELHRRGIDVSSPLFSARAVLEAPEAVAAVHRDYLLAGADIICSATFRAHRRSLAKAGWESRWREVVNEAVRLADEARRQCKPDAKVFGSIGPLEDCYCPEAAPSEPMCSREHGEMIQALLDAGVDGVLIETIGTAREVAAAAQQAAALAPGGWIISFLTNPAPPGVDAALLSGESLLDLYPMFGDALAVGVNCAAAPDMQPQVAQLRQSLPARVAVCAYANTGRRDEHGNWHDTDAVSPERYAAYARTWAESGATIIGGCCGTTPATISELATRLRRS